MSDVIWLTEQEDLENVINKGGRVVIDFTAPAWCGPCIRFAPHFERAAANTDDITFVAVDVDKADWAMVAYGVQAVPTVKLYDGGEFVRNVKAPQAALPFISDIKE